MKQDQLLQEYASVTSEKERARIEAEIWDAIPQSRRESNGIYQLGKLVDQPGRSVRLRHTLWLAGHEIGRLWDLVESGLSLSTAVKVLDDAKKLYIDNHISIDQAISNVVAKLESDKVMVVMNDKICYKKDQNGVKKAKKPQPTTQSLEESKYRAFWQELRILIGQHVDQRLNGSDPETADRIKKNFEIDMRIVLSDVQQKINRAVKHKVDLAELKKIGRSEIVQACFVLGIDPPRQLHQVDIDVARRKRGLLAREYHPDKHEGSEAMRDKYHEIMESFDVLQRYNDQLRGTDESSRHA